MAELKTRKTEESFEAFLDTVTDAARREDCRTILKIPVLEDLVQQSVRHMKQTYG